MKELTTLEKAEGWWVPRGLSYKGKEIKPGIFANCAGLTEKGKDELFEKIKREIGKEAEGLDCYEVIEV